MMATHVVGEGTGPPLVLVHGVGLDHTMWDLVVPALARRHTVVRYDLWGHGRTDDPTGDRTLRDFVDQLVEVIDSLGVERCDVAGLSIGGLIVQAFGVDHPERCGRLAIMNAVYRRTPEQLAAIRGRLDGVTAAGMPAMVQPALDRWFTDEWRNAHPDRTEHVRNLLLANAVEPYLKAYRVFATDTSMDGRLHEITAPTLVLTGDRDVGSTVAMSEAMVAEIAHSRLVVLDDTRHLPPVECPDETVAALDAFFDPPHSSTPRHSSTQRPGTDR